MTNSRIKNMLVMFYGGKHEIKDCISLYLDPMVVRADGKDINWDKISPWHRRRIRRHLCPAYASDVKAKCDCQSSWEWTRGT